MNIYVDIDETICFYKGERNYLLAIPNKENIAKINKLYNEGHEITYWTARGSVTGIDWRLETEIQLEDWDCKYHKLSVGEKPAYDLLICDKTKRIEEI
jgi:dTDP-4-dehydrorhamnose 3,5-epimerase-like enzyme